MPLDQLFSTLTASNSDGSSSLGNVLNTPSTQGALSGAASGALVSLLMNKKMRKKIGKNAGKVGGAAALAGLGYLAYRHWQDRNTNASSGPIAESPAPRLTGSAAPLEVSDHLQVKMILSMIAAASADGTIDDQEMDLLKEAINGADISPSEKFCLTSALNHPPNVEEIAALSHSEEEACELYGAALSAIRADTPAEHLFLRRFASALKLDSQLVATIHQVAET